MSDEAFGSPDQTLSKAGEEARANLAQILSGLSGALAKTRNAGGSVFFPNGIERIYVRVQGGIPGKAEVVVELEIAGEKGLVDKSVVDVVAQSDGVGGPGDG